MMAEASEHRGDPDEWDRLVRERTGWTHFHLHGWKAVVEEVFGHECTYLCVRDEGGEIEGVLPMVRVKSLLFGDYLVSMPFLNYGGPLGTERAVQALASRAVEIAETLYRPPASPGAPSTCGEADDAPSVRAAAAVDPMRVLERE